MTDAEGLMDRTAQTNKEASGILVYLIEELGDARLRASQLKQYVAAALEMVEKSEKKDHFFEVAGDLLHGIPDTLFKMDKALDAAAMAASRMDYEEIKQGLKPEKADELERVLEDVRLQYLNRRSENMNAKSAAEMLDVFATVTDASGKVPAAELAGLIDRLEQGHKQASDKDPAQFFREAAEYLRSTPNPSRRELAATLRRVLADNLDMESAKKPTSVPDKHQLKILLDTVRNPMKSMLGGPSAEEAEEILREKFDYSDAEISRLKTASDDVDAGAGEQFKKVNPDISDEAVERINEQHEKNKDVVKEKHADDANVLSDFEAAFRAAKVAKANADAGNEKKAALFGLHAIQEMAEALAGITPKFSDKMLAIAAKAEGLRAGVVSDAARSDALPVTASGVLAGQNHAVKLFDSAFTTAKLANTSAEQGNARKAASFSVTAIEQMTRALGAIAPTHRDFLSAIGEKVDSKRASIVSDAIEASVFDAPAPTPDLDDFNAPWSRHHYAGMEVKASSAVAELFDLTDRYAKDASMAAQRGNARSTAINGVRVCGQAAQALAATSPKFYSQLVTMGEKVESIKASVVANAFNADALSSADSPGAKLFEAAYVSAKLANRAAQQGNARKAAANGVAVFGQTARALGMIAPEFADRLNMVSDKIDSMKAAILAEAVKADAFADLAGAPGGGLDPSAVLPDADDYGIGITAKFPKGKPADPTENMTDEDAAEWQAMNEQHADKFKTAADDYGLTAEGLEAGSEWKPPAINKALAQAIAKKVDRHFVTDLLNEKLTGRSWEAKLKEAIGKAVAPKQMRDLVEAQPAIKAWLSGLGSSELAKIRDLLEETLNKGKAVQYHSTPDAFKSASDDYGLTAEDDKAARFEQGKPADPTENMSPEDAEEWRANTEQYGDKFKAATYSR